MFVWFVGPIAEGQVVHHRFGSCPKSCCRPSHLMLLESAREHRLLHVMISRAIGQPLGRPRRAA
jgi:hypothetical protein